MLSYLKFEVMDVIDPLNFGFVYVFKGKFLLKLRHIAHKNETTETDK